MTRNAVHCNTLKSTESGYTMTLPPYVCISIVAKEEAGGMPSETLFVAP